MRKLAIALAFLFALTDAQAARTYLFVSHMNDKKISVIDTATNGLIRDIKLDCLARDMELSPDGEYLYFAGFDTNSVGRIRLKTLAPDSETVSVGLAPVALAVSRDGSTVYAANSKSKNISIIDTAAYDVRGEPLQLPGTPKAVALSTDGARLYAALAGQGGIAVMDTKTGEISGVIQTGADPYAMCVSDNRLFVTNEGMASISVIDTRKNRLVNEIVSTDSPRGIDYIGGMLYVAVMNGVDMFETGKYEKPASSGFDYPVYGVAAGKSPSGPRAYVAGFNKGEKTGKIAVIDASENEVIEEFDLAGSPMYLEIKKDRPTTAPTKAATAMPTDTPVPAATATPEPTATPVPKAAKKAAKKPAKKPAPEPTVNPGLTSALSGRVFMDNSPVANVRIKALSKHSDRVYRTTTDEAGRFVFEALPIGGYVISVEATYIKETALAVTVNKGKNPAITINVKKR